MLGFFVLSAIAIGSVFAVKFHHKNNELVVSKWKSLGDLKSDAEKGDAEAQFMEGIANFQSDRSCAGDNGPPSLPIYSPSHFLNVR